MAPASGLVTGDDGIRRCGWPGRAPDYRDYHDREWGRPVRDDAKLFEKICLEGFQAGLSWLTILRKRENFRRAFRQFDFRAVARFDRRSVERLLRNPGIVRHRGKIEAALANARRACELAEEFGSLAAYVWGFEPPLDSRPGAIPYATLRHLTESRESRALAADLKHRGWRFVGPTTAYAFMQSMGPVNDHLEGCAFREPVESARRRFRRPRARGARAPGPARQRPAAAR